MKCKFNFALVFDSFMGLFYKPFFSEMCQTDSCEDLKNAIAYLKTISII